MKISLSVIGAALLSLGTLAQGAQEMSHAEVTSLLSTFSCKVSAPGVNGGAGQQCMNGLVETVVIAQRKIYVEGAKEKIVIAYPKIKQAFPAAVLTPSSIVVIPL
jgi:hypothetical protein